MKASEMTNEELAIYLTAQSHFLQVQDTKDALLEAAARLRNVTVRSDELQRRLDVSESALVKLQAAFVCSVHDGTIDPYGNLKIVEEALSEIRTGSVVQVISERPTLNCLRFSNYEDALKEFMMFCQNENGIPCRGCKYDGEKFSCFAKWLMDKKSKGDVNERR